MVLQEQTLPTMKNLLLLFTVLKQASYERTETNHLSEMSCDVVIERKPVIFLLQEPLLSDGDLSTMIERVPYRNTDGHFNYYNKRGVSWFALQTCETTLGPTHTDTFSKVSVFV